MAKVPKRRIPRAAGYGSSGTGVGRPRGVAAVPTLQRRQQAQATFSPVNYNFQPRVTSGVKSAGLPRTTPGAYYPTSKHGAALPPVQFDPNADVFTVQGAINAGMLPYTRGLGGLGYTAPPRLNELTIEGYAGKDIGAGIANDWEMQAAMGDLSAANAADEASARANIEQLAIGWGGDLSNLVKQGAISQKTADAAKANQFSAMSELQRQLEHGQSRLQAQLAAAGILSSGALPGGEGAINREFQKESTIGLQELMGNIANIRNSVARARAERQQGLQSVRSSIAGRLMQLPDYQPIPTMTATWDPTIEAYVDPWGRRFDANKNQLGAYMP